MCIQATYFKGNQNGGHSKSRKEDAKQNKQGCYSAAKVPTQEELKS
jgi:hypothetical protein